MLIQKYLCIFEMQMLARSESLLKIPLNKVVAIEIPDPRSLIWSNPRAELSEWVDLGMSHAAGVIHGRRLTEGG